jgi:hypothetical protein
MGNKLIMQILFVDRRQSETAPVFGPCTLFAKYMFGQGCDIIPEAEEADCDVECVCSRTRW